MRNVEVTRVYFLNNDHLKLFIPWEHFGMKFRLGAVCFIASYIYLYVVAASSFFYASFHLYSLFSMNNMKVNDTSVVCTCLQYTIEVIITWNTNNLSHH